MVYLILEILGFLVAAAAIGFVVGWLCRSAAIGQRRETATLQANAAQGALEGQREQLELQLAELTSARNTLQEEVAQARQAVEADARTRRKLEREVARLTAELETRKGAATAAPGVASPAAPLVRQK